METLAQKLLKHYSLIGPQGVKVTKMYDVPRLIGRNIEYDMFYINLVKKKNHDHLII